MGSLDAIEHYGNQFAITPDSETDLTTPTRAIYVGSAGAFKITGVSTSVAVIFAGALAGTVYKVRASRVWAYSTSAADNLVGLA